MMNLFSLPPELLLNVESHLDLKEKINLSATCKTYRTKLTPHIFTTVSFTSNETSAKSALAAVEAYGKYTECIYFTCSVAGPDDELTTPALVPAAETVLRGSLTPNLRKARIRFAFDFDEGEGWDDHPDADDGMSIYVFEGVEDEDHVRRVETKWQWRALMNEMWLALSQNQRVRELVIDGFIPKWVSAFRTAEFHDFLARLETATISIWGSDNGAGWKTCTVFGYCHFLEHLDDSLFRHMAALKHLNLVAEDPLGLEGFRHIPLALKPDQLPALETLELKNCYVGPELVDFIRGHGSVLRTLDINGCASDGDGSGLAENPLYWAEFFDQVAAIKPIALTQLLVGDARVPLSDYEDMANMYDPDKEADEVKEIRKRLEEDPGLKTFGYAYMDDKYGMFFTAPEQNVEEFKKGDDQKAYNRLMAVVRANALNDDA